MKRRRLQQGKGALELIEEAVHLLRLAPAPVLLAYYAGALPFVLGLLYFWADMSRGSFAAERLPAAALGMALLFLWMKTWQTVFVGQLLARLCGEPAPRLTWRRFARAALVQAIVQPSGLFVLPVAAVTLLPLGYACAFYQNVTVLGTGETADLRPLLRRAWRLAVLWPAQNHLGLLILKLFGLFVFLNVCSGFLTVPFLLKTLLGVETVFTRSFWAVLNPTFFAAMVGLTCLCLDPLAKTFFVLRAFYGESLQTGQDLKTELRGLVSANKLAIACLALGWLALPLNAQTSEKNSSSRLPLQTTETSELETRNSKLGTHPSLPSADLDRAISEIINQREFNWRLPREKSDTETEAGPITSFLRSVATVLRDWLRVLDGWLEKILRAIFGDRLRSPRDSDSGAWMTRLQGLMMIVLVALACLLGVMLVRMWQRRRRRLEEVAAQPAQAVPDVADENVGADQLPEDGWSRLARELLDRGELRLALRAFYLASLAHLAERQLIGLARFKSNRDYERELARRSHALPDLTQRFSENVGVFDRVWYGLHEVTREMLDQFAGNVERIRGNT